MIRFSNKIGTAGFLVAVFLFLFACNKSDDGFDVDKSTDGNSYKTIKATAHHFFWSQGVLTDTIASGAIITLYTSEQDRSMERNSVRSGTTDASGKYDFTFLSDSLYFIRATYLDMETYENIDFRTAGDLLFVEVDFYKQ